MIGLLWAVSWSSDLRFPGQVKRQMVVSPIKIVNTGARDKVTSVLPTVN